MKALLWQCTFITTLCLASQCVATNQFDNSKFLPEKYLSLKRTKPSLSIVNPLDVLRQRVVLEMARRQRENAIKQAELNREILKSIGKRGNSMDYNDIEEYLRNRYYDTSRGYAPISYQEHQQSIHENLATNKAEPRQQTHLNTPQNLSQKTGGGSGGKVDNENKLMAVANGNIGINEASPNQDQVYQVFDEGNSSNNIDDDDDEMQVKYLYSLLKNRIPNSI